MGEFKRAKEQRIDEDSVEKIKEISETIQPLTYQLQQVKEQINSLSDSGDFQDVASNFCERLSRQKIIAWHVKSIWITGKRFGKSIF